MAIATPPGRPRDRLASPRPRARYNGAEQQFSLCLQARLQELLQGRRDALDLLRRYPADPRRLGVMATPSYVARKELRLDVAEKLLWDTIAFVRLKAAGGPVALQPLPDGGVLERQTFPTKFPHIVLERSDRYAADGDEPVAITWRLRRLQNQRAQTHLNRLFDAANLLVDLVRLVV